MKKCVLLMAVSIGMAGCSYTKPDVSTWNSQIAAQQAQRVACEERKKAEAVSEAAYIKSMGDVAQAVYVATKNQARVVAAATGHDPDSCNTGATVNDVMIAEVTSKNDALKSVVGSVGNATIITAGIVEAGKTARAGIQNAGSKTNVAGDSNTTRVQDSRTNTDTKSTATAVTGDSSVSSSPSVSGAPSTAETTQQGVVPEGSTLAGTVATEPVAASAEGQ